MRVDLRNLIRSQEAYHAAQGTYSRRTEPLALQYLWQRGVTVDILSADPGSGRRVPATQRGRNCIIWHGQVRLRPVDAQRSSESPVPVCDSSGAGRAAQRRPRPRTTRPASRSPRRRAAPAFVHHHVADAGGVLVWVLVGGRSATVAGSNHHIREVAGREPARLAKPRLAAAAPLSRRTASSTESVAAPA
jgi:hypothetical protein